MREFELVATVHIDLSAKVVGVEHLKEIHGLGDLGKQGSNVVQSERFIGRRVTLAYSLMAEQTAEDRLTQPVWIETDQILLRITFEVENLAHQLQLLDEILHVFLAGQWVDFLSDAIHESRPRHDGKVGIGLSPLLLQMARASIEKDGRGLQLVTDAILVRVETRDDVLHRLCPRRSRVQQEDFLVEIEIVRVAILDLSEKGLNAFAGVIAIVGFRTIGHQISVSADENYFSQLSTATMDTCGAQTTRLDE